MFGASGAIASSDAQLFMEADKFAYDSKRHIVVAKGNVEVVRDGRIVLADTLYYYQDQNMVKAQGNVSLLNKDGNVTFAESLMLEPDLKYGVIQQFKARFPNKSSAKRTPDDASKPDEDDALFAAAEARRMQPHKIELRKAVYSPCKICAQDPEDDPLWQIKANKIRVNAQKQQVSYRDATLEVMGVPVFYTPYFSHPTPDADRKSGVLTPEYAQSTNLGVGVRIPYYLNIAPDKDATITPWWTSKEGVVLLGQYRQRTDEGSFLFDMSGTLPDKRDNSTGELLDGQEFRGHMFAQGRDRLTDEWDWGFNINRASDDTYLRRYQFGFFETLNSRAYTERMDDRDYAVVEGLAFQALDGRVAAGQDPFILPHASVHVESDPLSHQGRVHFDADAMALARDEGTQTRRVTTETGYHIPYVTPQGHVFGADAGVRVDAYHQEDLTVAPNQELSGTQGRVVPHAALSWRYPLMRQVANANLTVEPMAKVIASTRGHNPNEIANEDSLTPELNAMNLFRTNRFSGQDRIEEGSRAIAGVRTQLGLPQGRNLSAMLGQEVRLDDENPFPTSDNPKHRASDVVGQFGFDGQTFFFDYQYRLDAEDMALRRNEVRGLYEYGYGLIGADYVRIDGDPVLLDRHDLTAIATWDTPIRWLDLNTFGRRDMLRDTMVTLGGGFVIDYDCITLTTTLNRNYTSDRDFQRDTSIMVRLGLKSLN
jgi:LPS-assembly protein